MNGQRVGYVRVSTVEQNPVRQFEGVARDRTFTDTASGKDTERPELDALLGFVRDGDTVIVHSMDRLARNLDDLRRLVADLTGRGVRVEFVTEGLVFTGEDAPLSKLLLPVMGALVRTRADQRTPARRHRCRENTRRLPRPAPIPDPAQIIELTDRAAAGEPKAALAKAYGISRETVYQYLRAATATAAPATAAAAATP